MLGEEPTEEPLSVAARNFPRPRCVSLFVNGINANFKLELLQAPLQRMHLDATLNCFLLYSATECASSSDLMPPTFVRTLTMSRFSTSGSSCWSQNVEILPISSIDSDLQLSISFLLPNYVTSMFNSRTKRFIIPSEIPIEGTHCHRLNFPPWTLSLSAGF